MHQSSSENLNKHKITLYTRTLDAPAIHAGSAHDFFQSNTLICAGLLEDPKGSGHQFIVSSAGLSYALEKADSAKVFFFKWRESIQSLKKVDFPTLHHIFYMAYEAGTLFEQLPQPKTSADGGLIWRHEPSWCVCFSVSEHKVYISSTSSNEDLDMLEEKIRCGAKMVGQSLAQAEAIQETVFDYKSAVASVQQYITAGDIFQANIARFWQTAWDKADAYALYAKLREVNPAPFACFLKADDLTLISASPERLFSIDTLGKISARPIAGTRKRSDGKEDDLLSDELLLSEKERAEHIMLLDLERNDLGRVCEPGSIHVDECMVIEKYTTVQHIVSNVSGKLEEQYDMLDVIEAMFPGGTITGCPKVHCMEIIHELEPKARGPYTGGVGYMAWDGSVDMNILIRTFWLWQNQLHWAAGAGIVADSVPKHEELETEHKVAGLLRALV